jgi:hypothetical protein
VSKSASASPTAKEPAEPDLSHEVAAMVDREPGDQVRCTNIGGNRYRCNWWSARRTTAADRGSSRGLESTELRVRKSSLLVVARSGERLLLTELTGKASEFQA